MAFFEKRERKLDDKKKPDKKKKFKRRKVCRICTNPEIAISYRDLRTLTYFVSDKGKIVSRRISGICAKHQRQLSKAIKRSRNLALMPFVVGMQ